MLASALSIRGCISSDNAGVTLRWKFINCVVAFIGGLGLSRLLISTEDVAILVLVHYFFTFFNTPLPPERR